MRKAYLAVMTVSSLMSACVYQPVPLETNRPVTYQFDMQAADHWDKLAEQVATNIEANLPKPPTAYTSASASTSPAPMPTPLPAPMPSVAEDPLSNLPPGTLPPPGPTPGDEAMAASAAPAPATSAGPKVVQFDFSAPSATQTGGGGGASTDLSQLAITTPTNANNRPLLYINPPRGGQETVFNQTFHDLLRTHLVQKGVAITNRPDGANSYCTQNDFCRPMILDYAVEVVKHKDRRYVRQPDTEVVVSTALMDGDLVLFSRSDIYYINAGDDDHYDRGMKTLKVVDQ